MDNKKRCVVTGLGMISAIGNNLDECWNNALKGVSGIKEVNSVDSTGCYANLGAEVNCDELDDIENSAEMDRVSKLCVKAALMACKDGNFTVSGDEADKVGVIMGSCVGGAVSVENFVKNGENKDDITKMTISPIANHVAAAIGAGGVVSNIANACAAGTISIAYACELIRAGVADAFVVGGSDAFSSVPYSGFLALHALDTNACSPFNKSSGITLGEGAGALIVESYEHAVKRGAKIYCDALGAGISSDAHHITAPRPDGEGQIYAIRKAMENSGVKEEDVDYINAHGTGTRKNDEAEFLSLHTIFDGKNSSLNVSSTKSMVGHCLGAAGAIEAVFAVKALTENKVPPTVGYTAEDLEALKEKAGDIDFTPNEAKEKQMDCVMSNSFAFGGNNASIIFAKEGKGEIKEEFVKDKVYVTGIGLVTPVGNGVKNYVEAVNSGKKPEGDSVMSSVTAADYADVGLTVSFYRKLDRFSQLQAISGMQAIKDSGLTVTNENAFDIGIIVGTSDGPIATVYNFEEEIARRGNSGGSAFKFPNTVYNAAGGYLSICSGIKGYNVTVTNGAQSGLASLAYAYNVIKEGKESVMLATGTDENCETMTKLYDASGAIENSEVYSAGDGFVLGDGSATLVLASESYKNEHDLKAYAEVAGYAMTHKSVKFGTISGSEEALINSVNLALKNAGVKNEEVDAIIGFGNGMKAFDEIEIDVYDKLFKSVPVLSVKGITGEGRAASAAISAAHASLILSGEISGEQEICTFVAGKAEKRKVDVSSFKTILVTACSVGGSYCSMVLKKA